jgi:hypothetical protein
MKYNFFYFFNKNEDEKTIVIDANDDREAVMIFYSKVGIAKFGCIKEDKHFFTDDDFNKEKQLILIGC